MSTPRRTSCTSFSISWTQPALSSAFPPTSSPAFLRRSNRRLLRCSAWAPSVSSTSEPKRRPQARKVLIDLTLDKFASRHPHRCDIVRYLFGGLLLELGAALEMPSHWDVRTVNAIDLFRQFRDLIQETIGAIGFSDDPRSPSHTVESFASRLSTTAYALNVACQSVCGCSARDLIHTAILEQATRLLLYTTRPVKEISYLLGYSHASHFTRFFKQRLSVTPEIFRSTAPRDRWVELPSGR